ncbi:MAG TPA: penicillin-binding protein 2 [Anaerolineae bacterium]|nr:penicillin-binding protein 2 [Anaerolineae bacterium]
MRTAQQSSQSNGRVLGLYAVVGLVLAAFVLRLWQMQIVEASAYRTLAENNRLRLVTTDAPRGIVYDRNGQPLVRNMPLYDVAIVPAYVPDEETAALEIYTRLGQLLDLPVSGKTASAGGAGSRGIQDIVEEARGIAPYRPVTVRSNVPRDVALQIMEESPRLPGVQTVVVPSREYPLGLVNSHVVGYIGRYSSGAIDRLGAAFAAAMSETNRDSLLELRYSLQQLKNYDPDTDRVGLTGVEAVYDDWLRGTKGERYIEEDVAGRQVRVVGEPIDPAPGHNLYLTIDEDLQQFALEALQAQIDTINSYVGSLRTKRGAVIAMDPRSGQILALVSLPTFDNNLFARGISLGEYDALLNDPFLPLLNHAISDQVPPGSIFKIIPAAAALQEKIVTRRTLIYDPGAIVIPNRYFPDDPRQASTFVCWLRSGHGAENIVKAIADSCDVFFYQLGGGYDVPNQPKFEGLGLKKLVEYQKSFGLGQLTGIDLLGEAPGHVVDAQWKRLNYGENWSTGDTYNLSIGQGYALATPLQMLHATAAVANGGTLYRPQMLLRITDADGKAVKSFQPDVIRRLPVDPDNLAVVREGMAAAVSCALGSCTAGAAQVAGLTVAGKTGTAEFCDDLALKLRYCAAGQRPPTHAWFTAYAPAENPQIALVVYIYNGGEGSAAALPVAQRILQHWFDRQPGGTP